MLSASKRRTNICRDGRIRTSEFSCSQSKRGNLTPQHPDCIFFPYVKEHYKGNNKNLIKQKTPNFLCSGFQIVGFYYSIILGLNICIDSLYRHLSVLKSLYQVYSNFSCCNNDINITNFSKSQPIRYIFGKFFLKFSHLQELNDNNNCLT